ncbi:MAG: thioredoxin domain-containing protein, partial [Candidatus Hodarchaeota archaeon]
SQTEDTKVMLETIQTRFLPNKVVILRPLEEKDSQIIQIIELIRNYPGIEEKATAYVCSNYNCKLPTTEIGQLKELLK